MRIKQGGNIGTASARAKFRARREPYWVPIVRGCALGYRKGKTGGTWIARMRGDEGRQTYAALGIADDALTCIALALNPKAKVLLAPAMNGKMWLHPATQQNVETLRKRGAGRL